MSGPRVTEEQLLELMRLAARGDVALAAESAIYAVCAEVRALRRDLAYEREARGDTASIAQEEVSSLREERDALRRVATECPACQVLMRGDG